MTVFHLAFQTTVKCFIVKIQENKNEMKLWKIVRLNENANREKSAWRHLVEAQNYYLEQVYIELHEQQLSELKALGATFYLDS